MPIPTTAAEVPGPASGTVMTPAYVQSVGRMAYMWGWALVNNANRHAMFSTAPEPGLLGGELPVAHNALAMLTHYVSPAQTFVTCTNQDVVYGFGFLDNLDEKPIVFQVPDFGKRFWVYALYDARTDELSRIGQQYGTKPSFYMIVGPKWKGNTPAGINAVLRSSTSVVAAAPRIFMDDTPEDRAAIQPLLSRVDFYPLAQFDGKMKVKDWTKLPSFPAPKSDGGAETKWVNPETFFDQLPVVMKDVPPLTGEEALYELISSVLAADNDPALKRVLNETAVAAEKELVSPLFQFRNVGAPVGNGWNSQTNAARWGTDFLNRTAMAKSSMYGNQPTETRYFSTDDDTQGARLDGNNSYAVTFAKGQLPPTKGFWSLTMYNDLHMFQPNDLKRYSLGTKNKNLKFNADGSLTLYLGSKSPGAEKEANWLPAPAGEFSLLMRNYWPDESVLKGEWKLPAIKKGN